MNDTTITLVGNVATQPERRRTGSGDAVTRFRVATSPRRWDRDSARWQDGHTSWYSVSVFRRLGDHAFSSLSKGDRVVLTGRLRIRTWESGDKRGTDAEIEAEAIGHDLLWGTTRFEQTSPAAPSEQSADEWAAAPADDAGAATAATATPDGAENWPTVVVPEDAADLQEVPF